MGMHTTVCVLRTTVREVTSFCIEYVIARCTTVSKVNMVVGDSLIVSDVYAWDARPCIRITRPCMNWPFWPFSLNPFYFVSQNKLNIVFSKHTNSPNFFSLNLLLLLPSFCARIHHHHQPQVLPLLDLHWIIQIYTEF